jgi:hypothetical protein
MGFGDSGVYKGVFMRKRSFLGTGMAALVMIFGVGAAGCEASAGTPKSVRITNINLPPVFASSYIWICSRTTFSSYVSIYAIAKFPGDVTGTITIALKYPNDSKEDGYISNIDWFGSDGYVLLIPFVNGAFDTDHALKYPKRVSFDDDTPLVTLDFTAFEKVYPSRWQ